MINLQDAGVTIKNREHLLIVLQKLEDLGCYWRKTTCVPEDIKATRLIPLNCISLAIHKKSLSWSDEWHHFSKNDITEQLDKYDNKSYKDAFCD
jgi:hypothetical protein